MNFLKIAIASATALCSGCASIMGKWSFDIPVDSSVPGTRVAIYAGLKHGKLVKEATTPTTVTLKPGGGWQFWPLIRKPATYRFEFSKEGYADCKQYRVAEANNWFAANVPFAAIFVGLGFMIFDSHTGTCYKLSEVPVYAKLSKVGDASARISTQQSAGMMKYTLEDLQAKADALPLENTFQMPMIEERPIESLPRDWLVGKWQMITYRDESIWLYQAGWNDVMQKKFDRKRTILTYTFNQDGTFLVESRIEKMPPGRNCGSWSYDDGILTLLPEREGVINTTAMSIPTFNVIWFSANEMALDMGEAELTAARNRDANANKYFTNQKAWATATMDKFGCERFEIYHKGDNGVRISKSIVSPRHFKRISEPKKLPAQKLKYRMISCARDDGDEFSYRYAFELTGNGEESLQNMLAMQREIRSVIGEAYVETVPNADKQSIRIDLPEYRQSGNRIEGRAVVLTMSIVKLEYNPNTRAGVLAVKIGANQFDEARKYIRKNIETLARDKNIALVTGEIPPAAKFYLGREEIKDGNILEIEFKTE